jgi:iron complex outermembrane receptor protein
MKNLFAGASVLALVVSAGVVHAADAAAADAAAAASADADATVSEVIVTGTRQTGVKAADSAAPIQVVGGEALKSVGQPDLIQTLSQQLPSFNAQSYGADTAALTLSAALRGLSPNDTLVLVNGKRLHTTANMQVDSGSPFTGAAAADLSFIPVAAIDHVEVLQDGAAAQYGSDAVAGVVNIILKKADSGGTAQLSGGQFMEGDGATGSFSINKGFALGSKGFLNVTAEEDYHEFTQQGTCDARFYTQSCQLAPSITAGAAAGNVGDQINAAGLPNAPSAPNVNKIYGDPQYNIYKTYYNAGYDLGGGLQFYTFGSYGHRDASAYENYRAPDKVAILGSTVADSVVPYPDGFDPREATKEDDYSVTGGLKGESFGWNWDLSTTYGDDRQRISTINSANLSLLDATGATPTNFYDGTFETSEWTNNLDISREFAVGLASPLNVAFGGEVRHDTFTIDQGSADSSYGAGAQAFPGFLATDAGEHSRTNYSAYVDFAVDPITGLHIDTAGRFEHYTDFGSTEIGKVTARYDFNPKIAIRGTVSSGFRAPTLQEEFYSATNVTPSSAAVQLPANSAAAAQAGFAPLKPEISHNYSVGFVAHPIDRLQITADAYEIIIHDRIINSGFLLGTECSSPTPAGGCASNAYTVVSQGVNNAIAAHGNVLDSGLSYTGMNIFANAANTRTRGIEATATYATDFGDAGHVDWSVGFNYNETSISSLTPLPSQVTNAAQGQTELLTPTSISALTTGTPREKVVFGAFYSHDRWTVNLRETIYGPSSIIVSTNGTGDSYPGNPATNLVVPVAGITDLDVGYQITKSLKVDIGANNLLNKKPPTVPVAENGEIADGNHVYDEPDTFAPYGINGGYYYGKVTLSF